MEREHAHRAHGALGRQHDQERLGQRAHGVDVDERVAEQLAAAIAAVDAHESRLEAALRELLDPGRLLVAEQDRLVVDAVRVGERERERLAAAVEDLRATPRRTRGTAPR